MEDNRLGHIEGECLIPEDSRKLIYSPNEVNELLKRQRAKDIANSLAWLEKNQAHIITETGIWHSFSSWKLGYRIQVFKEK